MNRIILFTRQYPFGYQESFLDLEIQYLSNEFDRIVIIPNLGGSSARNVPENVIVDSSMSLKKKGKLPYFLQAISSLSPRLLLQEIITNLTYYHYPRAFWRSITYLEEASRVQGYLSKLYQAGELVPGNTICYSYWLRGQALGVSQFKDKHPRIVFVSRAHGGDLYRERHNPPYLPFRREILRNVDVVFPISRNGVEYLGKHYNYLKGHLELARLGVKDPGFTSLGSSDGVIRVVTCSSLIEVKRLDLLIEGLAEFSRQNPTSHVLWNHLGDGPLKEQLVRLANNKLNDNVNWRFIGQLTQEEVIGFYRSNFVDVFINVSSSEGIPVSIMEAQSCGIPVVATAVGGVPEIVNNINGVLLPAHPDPGRIARAIAEVVRDPTNKRTASKDNWREKYHAEKNYQDFIMKLQEIR